MSNSKSQINYQQNPQCVLFLTKLTCFHSSICFILIFGLVIWQLQAYVTQNVGLLVLRDRMSCSPSAELNMIKKKLLWWRCSSCELGLTWTLHHSETLPPREEKQPVDDCLCYTFCCFTVFSKKRIMKPSVPTVLCTTINGKWHNVANINESNVRNKIIWA